MRKYLPIIWNEGYDMELRMWVESEAGYVQRRNGRGAGDMDGIYDMGDMTYFLK